MTNQDAINKLVPIYSEIEILLADAKVILGDAKEAGLDQAMLAKVSKAIAANKLGEVRSKTEELLNFIDEVDSE